MVIHLEPERSYNDDTFSESSYYCNSQIDRISRHCLGLTERKPLNSQSSDPPTAPDCQIEFIEPSHDHSIKDIRTQFQQLLDNDIVIWSDRGEKRKRTQDDFGGPALPSLSNSDIEAHELPSSQHPAPSDSNIIFDTQQKDSIPFITNTRRFSIPVSSDAVLNVNPKSIAGNVLGYTEDFEGNLNTPSVPSSKTATKNRDEPMLSRMSPNPAKHRYQRTQLPRLQQCILQGYPEHVRAQACRIEPIEAHTLSRSLVQTEYELRTNQRLEHGVPEMTDGNGYAAACL